MKRSTALDALRGLAIIGMVLSGTVSDTLPAWMYHAQVGPRSGMTFDPSFVGLTWVDLVFPFFLFAMGAAFPLALSRKLDQGTKPLTLFPSIFKRAFLLVLFAIAIYHCTPYRLGGAWNYVLALIAFLLFFVSFVRIQSLSEKANALLNWSGIGLIIGLIAFNVTSQPDVFKVGFKLSHNDIIILVLANMAVFGAIVWMFTRSSWIYRIGVLVFLLALRLTGGIDGSWNQFVWNFNPMQLLPESMTSLAYENGGWLYRMDFLKYLFIVLPGTMVGDILLKWFSDEADGNSKLPSKTRMWFVLVLMIFFVISNLVCLFSRYLLANLLLNGALSAIGYFLLRKPTHSLTRMYHRLYKWGVVWLMLGTFLESFEGGIRKDDATLSYFFVTAGLAVFTLLFFSIVIDYFGKNNVFRSVSECGQNPMMAYVAGTFLVVPLLVLSGLMPYINRLHEFTPWLGLVKGLIITSGTMAVTVFAVRRKWFWKT